MIERDTCPRCGESYDDNGGPVGAHGDSHAPGICELCFEADIEAEEAEREEYGTDYDGSVLRFADPGGNSALRAAGPGNPRNLPCPTCGAANRLTPKDKALGYQCDSCADRVERGLDLY